MNASSHPVLDIGHLRNLVGDDPQLRHMLLEEFFSSARQALAQLENNVGAQNRSAWREAAHGFKGICYNLGALQLGQLCHIAQLDFEEPEEVKSELYVQIESGYYDLEDMLKNTPAL